MNWNLDLSHLGKSLNPLIWIHGESTEIESRGLTSDKFSRARDRAYREISREFRDYVRANKGEISSGQVMTDIVPPDQAERKSGLEDGRAHANLYHGLFDARIPRAMIAEYCLRRDVENPAAATENLREALKKNPTEKPDSEHWILNTDVQGTVHEEFFHLLDACLRLDGYMSETPSFRAAYEADIAAMGGTARAKSLGFSYFIQNDPADPPYAGVGETFGQLGAYHVGSSTQFWTVSTAFPRTSLWMQEFQEGFKKAYRKGPDALFGFTDDFGFNRLLPPDTLQMKMFQEGLDQAFERGLDDAKLCMLFLARDYGDGPSKAGAKEQLRQVENNLTL